MCIIAVKPAGIKMPERDQIEIMWHNNPDGAGIMYSLNGKVYIEKGFMSLIRFSCEYRTDKNFGKPGQLYRLSCTSEWQAQVGSLLKIAIPFL